MTTIGGSLQSSRMVSDTWLTPPQILDRLGGFDLDPCAAPEPRPWPTAARMISPPEDGLTADWAGRCWCNPPYNREAVRWLRRMATHNHGTALTFARTDTSWFIETVWHRAAGALFLHGRLYFCRADGVPATENAGAPSVLVAYGEADAAILRNCGIAGTYVEWKR